MAANGTPTLKSDENPLDQPAMTGNQITGSVTTTDHPISRADYRVDAP
jgi:hypothetical protein